VEEDETMAVDAATLTVATHPALVGTCDLCATPAVVLAAAAVVRHGRGGTVQLLACESCARAARRLVAALGTGALVAAEVVELPVAVPPPVAPTPLIAEAVVPAPVAAPPPEPHAPPQLIAHLQSEVISADSRRWSVRVYGEPRADGTWVGWLEFGDIDGVQIVRTRQETSQPDRGALAYWAGGLAPTYLEGAFSRAR
jgi:hypothetical protein